MQQEGNRYLWGHFVDNNLGHILNSKDWVFIYVILLQWVVRHLAMHVTIRTTFVEKECCDYQYDRRNYYKYDE